MIPAQMLRELQRVCQQLYENKDHTVSLQNEILIKSTKLIILISLLTEKNLVLLFEISKSLFGDVTSLTTNLWPLTHIQAHPNWLTNCYVFL